MEFKHIFRELTRYPPFPWQERLYTDYFAQGRIPEACDIPTGLGKTSVIAVWLIALAKGAMLPRRLAYVVNRRTVVDQTTDEVNRYRDCLANPTQGELAELANRLRERCALDLRADQSPLAISTLRGQMADNREWCTDPCRPAVICGTVDMIGSRLLFSGYGIGFRSKPLHAGFLGQDTLLVHDEAHLEPAFQELLDRISNEQTSQERSTIFGIPRLQVLQLSATARQAERKSRENRVIGISSDDKRDTVVKRRIHATKGLTLHRCKDDKKLAEQLAEKALEFADSGAAVLVFVRSVKDAHKVRDLLHKKKQHAATLTGTMRGWERDRQRDPRNLDGCPIFARFMPPPKANAAAEDRWQVKPCEGTAYLVCTSAGEVGVNLSAQHLVCDLSTFESMAQRFGRVNRFGEHNDTQIHVVHPAELDDGDAYHAARKRTLTLLRRLKSDASPAALGDLDIDNRLAAFSPKPVTLEATDILFDAWALTSIRESLPGRPPVASFLHGLDEPELPETHVAWRDDVQVLMELSAWQDWDARRTSRIAADWLEDFPLKPHELLREPSYRALEQLDKLSERHPTTAAWLVSAEGEVDVLRLAELLTKRNRERVNGMIVLLPPEVGALTADGHMDASEGVSSARTYDVASVVSGNQPQQRCRLWDTETKPAGMRLIREIDTRPDADDEDNDATASEDVAQGTSLRRFWQWYERPNASEEGRLTSSKSHVELDDHLDHAAKWARRIVDKLPLEPALRDAVVLSAQWHDFGKHREKWQRAIGNPTPHNPWAKSPQLRRQLDVEGYRHEFGSLIDVRGMDSQALAAFPAELQDLVLHLIAAHHGRARPHFPADEVFDPQAAAVIAEEVAMEVPRRFARLQRRYGRWGLAYLESLLRAADWAASANPTEEQKAGEPQ